MRVHAWNHHDRGIVFHDQVAAATERAARCRWGVFGPAQLIQYISQFMSLEPGDLISTGTSSLGMKAPQYLKAGDVIELEIDGLGSQRQVYVQAWSIPLMGESYNRFERTRTAGGACESPGV